MTTDGQRRSAPIPAGVAMYREAIAAAATTCGDSLIDPYEQCDDGNRTNGDGCDQYCQVETHLGIPPPISPTCGDSRIDPFEQCDDGNQQLGDGCDQYCRIELPPPSQFPYQQQLPGQIGATWGVQGMQQPYSPYGVRFPYSPTLSAIPQTPGGLPLGSILPYVQTRGPIGDTGPAAIAIVAAGAGAGLAWVRRRKR